MTPHFPDEQRLNMLGLTFIMLGVILLLSGRACAPARAQQAEPMPGFARQAIVLDDKLELRLYKEPRSGQCVVVALAKQAGYVANGRHVALTSFPCHREGQ